MKTIPVEAKTIKITFVCYLCGVEISHETNVPLEKSSTPFSCFVCHKNFTINLLPTSVEVVDVADDDITIEVV